MNPSPEPRTIVVDASALVMALTATGESGRRFRQARRDRRVAAPEHLKVEVFNAICGRFLGGRIDPNLAADAVEDLGELSVELVPTPLLLKRCGSYEPTWLVMTPRMSLPPNTSGHHC